jgi:hypothetical protein
MQNCTIPLEICHLITQFVDGTNDWANCRLVCKDWSRMMTEEDAYRRKIINSQTRNCLRNVSNSSDPGNTLIIGDLSEGQEMSDLIQKHAIDASYNAQNVSVFLAGREKDMSFIFASDRYSNVPLYFMEQPISVSDFRGLVGHATATYGPAVASQKYVVGLDRAKFETPDTPLKIMEYLKELGSESVFIMSHYSKEEYPGLARKMDEISFLTHESLVDDIGIWEKYGKHFFASKTDLENAARKYENNTVKFCTMDTKMPCLKTIYCHKCL